MQWMPGVFHNPSGVYLDFESPRVLLRLRTPLGSPVQQIFLRCAPDGEQQMLEAQPGPPQAGYHCQWWEVAFQSHVPRLSYRFFLVTDRGCFWLTAAGLLRHLPTDHHDFQLPPPSETCPWLENRVFYQIFPDRFADGNSQQNVRDGEYLVDGLPTVARAWGERPDVGQGAREFFGGDLQGIEQKLDYLQHRLGINGIYLNPIGTAPSSHKYDVASYLEVDPHLGGQEAFLSLRQATGARDIRLVLDIIPNHCGQQHPWFQAALADPQAPSAEYFTFTSHPEDYHCWLGVRSLPKLNYASQRLREAMYSGPDAIMRHWLRPPWSIDGWRIDVANMLGRSGEQQLGHKIIRGMRKAVKEENPDCYLLGENFFDASSYLQGDELDANMNYRGFMMPCLHWLSGRDFEAAFGRQWGDHHPLATEELEAQWRQWRACVPWEATRKQFNLLDSHDTPRLLNLLDGNRQLAGVARLLLFTYPGIPCIYYGDEVGLSGGLDPDNRRPMEWDESRWDHDIFDHTRRLIDLRKSLPALQRGSIQVLLARHQTLAYLREDGTRRCLVVARRDQDEEQTLWVEPAAIPEGTVLREIFSGQERQVIDGHLELLPEWQQLWVSK